MATLLSCLLSFVQSPPKRVHIKGRRLADATRTQTNREAGLGLEQMFREYQMLYDVNV